MRPDTLLPPLVLYRHILRMHRRLPPSMRFLGDDYVKAEFRRHKDVDNPVYIVGFLQQWQSYLDALRVQTSPMEDVVSRVQEEQDKEGARRVRGDDRFSNVGQRLDASFLDKLSDQQLGQLNELREEVKRFKDGPKPEEDGKHKD
ncbi:hypothetical protein BZG36_05200 [Bifiguratus adelaidae]|uniref:Succinate dehydrogenase assembly factor 3 n=1 Tax=Bifiguratus adelaidae TaxID=1938954 RepID=A0A261XUH2_9FUNG|nr:hypothetical protein BZG36_05200 [Bifiguratus adelaidae]